MCFSVLGCCFHETFIHAYLIEYIPFSAASCAVFHARVGRAAHGGAAMYVSITPFAPVFVLWQVSERARVNAY